MIVPILAALLMASAPSMAPPADANTKAILVALMSYYREEFAKSSSVCIDPLMREGDFRGIKDRFKDRQFADRKTDDALLTAVPQGAARIPRSVLPRHFRLNSHEDCIDNLSFHAPARSGDYAFVIAHWMEIEDGAGGGTVALIGLQREDREWQVQSKQILLFMN